MRQAQINVRTRACSRTSIARTKQAALTHNVRGKELKKKKKTFFFFFFLVSRYLGHDTIHVSPAQVSRCIDASMHRYALNDLTLRTVTLLALVSAQRCQSLHLLDLDCMTVLEDRYEFLLSGNFKQSRAG